MATIYPTTHRQSHGHYYVDCGDERVYIHRSKGGEWIAKPASIPAGPAIFKRLEEAKEWAREILKEYA